MGTQPNNADIFSMCNCLTVKFPGVYTAHVMTMDLFLKKVTPGARVSMPYTDLWPASYIRVFKIPQAVDVFLFSPFNEAFNPSYKFANDEARYTMGQADGLEKLKALATEIPRLSPEEFGVSLQEVDKKVTSIWGEEVKKILVFYDNSRAEPDVKQRVIMYDRAVEKAVPWPIAQMEDRQSDRPKWCHYRDSARHELYKKIMAIVNNYHLRKE